MTDTFKAKRRKTPAKKASSAKSPAGDANAADASAAEKTPEGGAAAGGKPARLQRAPISLHDHLFQDIYRQGIGKGFDIPPDLVYPQKRSSKSCFP